jgi:hypothetical protein
MAEEVKFEEPEEETFDWSEYYPDDEDDNEAPAPQPQADSTPAPNLDEAEQDAIMYARLRAKYPHLFESSSGEAPTENDVNLMERLASMNEQEFKSFVAQSAREAILAERRVKETLFNQITKDMPLSARTKHELQKELEVMDPAQANAILANKESLEWMRNAILGKEVSSRGAPIPRMEPTGDVRNRRDAVIDESDPVIAAGLKMFGLTPEEVEEGRVRLPKKQ